MMPAPLHGQRDPRYLARLIAAMVPDDIAKSLSNDEYNDRITEMARLSGSANDPSLSPALRQAARLRAQAIGRAQPRQVTERQHQALVAKAAATRDPWHADAIRRRADQLLEQEHPVAPRRAAAIRKAQAAADAEPVAVFDEDGNLVGVVDQDDLTPVADARQPGSADVASGQGAAGQQGIADGQVVKSGQVIVYDQWRRAHLTARRNIRTTGRRIAKADAEDDEDPASADAQARDTGPVQAGGTTGLGQPRVTGPAGSLPADGPQEARPGDVADRQVVKGHGLQASRPALVIDGQPLRGFNPAKWTIAHDFTGRPCGVVKRKHVTPQKPGQVLKSAPSRSTANVYDAAARRVGVAKMANIIDVATLRAGGHLKAARTATGRRHR